MIPQSFAIDASLLQELGERLIGRAPIALAELVKNAFDADASTCRIEFSPDEIVISDDGTGMSSVDFLDHWMRIGTTHKVDQRVSPAGRALTGSKGIGRLSVQFLADEMVLESSAADSEGTSLYALVDWSKAVRGKDLSTVEVLWETREATPLYPNGSPTGTRITLSRLKDKWDAASLESLGREVWRLRSPFKRPTTASKVRRPDDFEIDIEAPHIESAREAFDKIRRILFASWKARITGTMDGGRSGGKASVSVEFRPGYPDGAEAEATFRESMALPVRADDPGTKPLVHKVKFEILIFRTEGRQPGGIPVQELRDYLSDFGNVSVYDAGFRLPYYGASKDSSGQDWLSIALDQGRRLNSSELLPERLRSQTKYMQDLPAPGRIFGAVEIDTNMERIAAARTKPKPSPDQWLQIQPGRDRLHDNGAFRQLRDLVRFSLDFYANRYRQRTVNAIDRQRDQEPASRKYDRALDTLDKLKDRLPTPAFREIRHELVDARRASSLEERNLDSRAALLAPLATAGMTALALNHELSRETRFLDRVGSRLRRIARTHELPDLMQLAVEFDDARKRLKSLQEIFAPLLSDVDSVGVDRLKVSVVVDQTVRAMRVLMPGVKFLTSGVPSDLRFPVGTLAEWSAVLQNIFANAWNATLETEKAQISVTGGRDSRGEEWLRVSDNGKGLGMPLPQAEKLFEPFERHLHIGADKRSIAIGGHGLGLAIVRMIAGRRAAKAMFTEAPSGYSTTIAISWKGAKK